MIAPGRSARECALGLWNKTDDTYRAEHHSEIALDQGDEHSWSLDENFPEVGKDMLDQSLWTHVCAVVLKVRNGADSIVTVGQ